MADQNSYVKTYAYLLFFLKIAFHNIFICKTQYKLRISQY